MSDFNFPNSPGFEPPKRSNRTLIIALVVFLVLCCCVAFAGFAYWFWEIGGDMLLEYLGLIPPQ